jgi:hypothetical protein
MILRALRADQVALAHPSQPPTGQNWPGSATPVCFRLPVPPPRGGPEETALACGQHGPRVRTMMVNRHAKNTTPR